MSNALDKVWYSIVPNNFPRIIEKIPFK